MQRLLIWLSGADSTILSRCTKTPESERRRFAGLGATVLIPAVLGVCSMTYAVSTFSTTSAIYFGAGISWFLIVLAIDRYLVSTLFKSRISSAVNFTFAVVLRFLFAGIVGLAVSHPLVLYFFNTSLLERLQSGHRATIDARAATIERQKQAISRTQAARLLDQKTSQRECLSLLLSAEQSGAYKGDVRTADGRLCGFSSGLPECGRRCENIRNQLIVLNREIGPLAEQVKADLDRVVGRTKYDLDEMKREQSTDYLARVRSLAELEREEPHIRVVRIFLIAFFVFLDTLLILLKATTPMGEYEEIRDTLLLESRVEQAAGRQAVEQSASTYRGTAEVERLFRIRRDHVVQIMTTTNEFIAQQERQRETFYERLKSIVRTDAKDSDDGGGHMARVAELRNIFNEAWEKAVKRFRDHLRSL